ncbi:MAG: hypothetical protein ACF8XB_20435 [Planctomycetota bacterium JB042]
MTPRDRSLASGARAARLVAALLVVACVVDATSDWSTPLIAGTGPSKTKDSDFDGIPDRSEIHLATASTAPWFATSAVNADSDGDGQPDGFEYCLSGGTEIVSPGKVHPVVPQVTLGSYQHGDALTLVLYVIPGDLKAIEQFHLMVGFEGPTGKVMLLDLTELFAVNIQSVGLATYGPHTMAVFQTSLPIANTVGLFPSLSIMALGSIAGVKTGDSATFTVHLGHVYRWRYHAIQSLDPDEEEVVQGEAIPQQTEALPGAGGEEVCSTTEVTAPTGTPGVVQRVTVAAGCGGGTWTCVAGICAALVGKKAVVLDHLEFLD